MLNLNVIPSILEWYEQAEFIEREMEQMTEQIKSVIQTLNANQAGELEVPDGMTRSVKLIWYVCVSFRLGTEQWIKSLSVQLNQVTGYHITYANNNYSLHYATIKGAGHAVSLNKPKEAAVLVNQWLASHVITPKSPKKAAA